MRRATITLPDALEALVDEYLARLEAPPSLTTLVQAALRQYLSDRRLEPSNPSFVGEEETTYDGPGEGVRPAAGDEPTAGPLDLSRVDAALVVKAQQALAADSPQAAVTSALREILRTRGIEAPESATFFGFEPLPSRGESVSNELIDRLRDQGPI